MGWFSNLLFGGDATKGINSKPQNYDAATESLWNTAYAAQGRQAPQIAGSQLAGGPQDQSRAAIYGVADRLGQIAAGTQRGAGEIALNRQLGGALAQQASQARIARGANAALAYRNAARNSASIGLAGASQAAAAQLQDQAAANQQLGQLYGQARAQDIDYAAQNAQLGQNAQLANQQARLQQTGLNDTQQLQSIAQLLGWDQARLNAEIQKAQIASQDRGIFPSLLQAGGTIGAAFAGRPPTGRP